MVKYSFTRFVYWVVLSVYVLLVFAEYVRPGFVSTVVNVHVMWFFIIPLTLVLVSNHSHDVSLPQGVILHALLVASGVVLALIAWHVGDVFGVMRFWFACVVGITPLAFFRFHR